MKELLKIRNLKKTYKNAQGKDHHALKGVNLDIFAGQVLGLLGPNGAGKTTLASLVCTLHPATSGSIEWNGKSIYENLFNYRQQIGYCPQKS